MLLQLTDFSNEPLHCQISRQLTDKIFAGDLEPGAPLQPARQLAAGQRISVHTVERAYDELLENGLITSQSNRNFSVAHLSTEQKQAIWRQHLICSQPSINIVESFSRQLLSIFDPKKLRSLFAENLKSALHTEHVYFGLENQKGQIDLYHDETSISVQADAFWQKFAQHADLYFLDAAEKNGELLHTLNDWDISLLLPLNDAHRLLGFVALTASQVRQLSENDFGILLVLANQFVTALTTARFYAETVERRHFQQELKMAKRVQSQMVPGDNLNNAHLSLAARMLPSSIIGGDMYDYFEISPTRFGMVIGDACGNGLAAALLISQAQVLIKSEFKNGTTIQQTLQRINEHILSSSLSGKFITLFYGIYDTQEQSFEYINAGHNLPLVVHSDSSCDFLTTSSPALGILPNPEFAVETVPVRSQDVFVFYTDGVTEAMNDQKEEFGEQRLLHSVQKKATETPQRILESLLQDVNLHMETTTEPDDRTVLVLKIK